MTRRQEDAWFLLFTALLVAVAAVLLHGCSMSCTLAAQEPLPALKPVRADPLFDYEVPRNQ